MKTLTPEREREIAGSLKRLVMRDLPHMTVAEHHGLCIGNLACCYEHVPAELKQAIAEMLELAKQMGMNIKPELVTGKAHNEKLTDRPANNQ